MLTKRLAACAEYVEGSGIVCDLGTDHAYLPVFLVKSGRCGTAYACDVASGPLESARANIERAGLSGKIKTILSDGLDSVPVEGVSDVVIAGMGGELIASILSRAPDLSGINLVLQPTTREPELYVWLRKNGYEIAAQKACEDGKFVYLVFKAHRAESKVPQECSELESIAGKLDIRLEESKKYIRRKINRIESAAAGMRLSEENSALSRRADSLEELAGRLREYLSEGDLHD